MAQKFCHNCGKEAQALWKACPYCETSFSSLSNKPVEAPKIQSTPLVVDREDDDDSYIDRAGSLSELMRGQRPRGLSVEIVKDQQIKETVGSVHSQATNHPQEPIIRSAPYSNVDSKAFLEEFRREAGTRGNVPVSE